MNSTLNLCVPGQPLFCINSRTAYCLTPVCFPAYLRFLWLMLSPYFASRKGPSLFTTSGPSARCAGRPKSGHRQGVAPSTLLSEERANKTGCLLFHLGLVWGYVGWGTLFSTMFVSDRCAILTLSHIVWSRLKRFLAKGRRNDDWWQIGGQKNTIKIIFLRNV